jgi:hypothetical protein
MKRESYSMSAYGCFLIALGLPVCVSAQAIHVTGRIPCAGRLDLVNSGPSLGGESLGLRGEGSGRSVQVRITDAGEDRVPVVLSLRTNCGYRVAAEWMGTADAPVRIAEAAVLPANGTAHLTLDALKATVTPVDLGPGAPVVCVAGRAISKGGNNTTSDNAILIRLLLQLPRGVPDATIRFTLNLGS